MKTRVTNAKIACLDINLQKQRMQLGVQIVVEDPDQLENIRKRHALFKYSSITVLNFFQGIRNGVGKDQKDLSFGC